MKQKRSSILKLGKDTQSLHKRQTKHLVTEFEKLKKNINYRLKENVIDFILDENYMNKFLIYMQNSFGVIRQNIPKPNIKQIKFDSPNKDELILELKQNEYNDNQQEEDEKEYEILRYEIAYYYKSDQLSLQIAKASIDEYDEKKEDFDDTRSVNIDNDDDMDDNDESDSGELLFAPHVTEGGEDEIKLNELPEEKQSEEEEKTHGDNNNDNTFVPWKFTEIQGKRKKLRIRIDPYSLFQNDYPYVQLMVNRNLSRCNK